MTDRQPQYPGRVLLTPVEGAENTYDMTMADEATASGTPLNKATLLKDVTAALFGLDSTGVPDEALSFLGRYNLYTWRREDGNGNVTYVTSDNRTAYPDSGTSGDYTYTYIGVPLSNVLGIPARVKAGSYAGTGSYGASNPTSIDIGFAADLVILVLQGGSNSPRVCVRNAYGPTTHTTWTDTGMSWYATTSAPDQYNSGAGTYAWVAIGLSADGTPAVESPTVLYAKEAAVSAGLVTGMTGDEVTDWAVGSLNGAGGYNITSSTRIRTVGYLPSGVERIEAASGYQFGVYAYSADDGTYQGIWTGSGFATGITGNWRTEVKLSDVGDYRFRLLVRATNDAAASTAFARQIAMWSAAGTEIKALEDMALLGYPIMITNAARLSELTGGANSADEFPTNRLIYVSGAVPDFANMAQLNGSKGGYYWTLMYSGGTVSDGAMQVFFSRYGGLMTRLRAVGAWSAWTAVVPNEVREYHVGPTREYTSLTQLCMDLAGDTAKKIIYLDPGEYDVYQEYRDAGVPSPPSGTSTSSYAAYCVYIPPNTKLVGIGDVTLKWDPAAADITEMESQIWSPLNVNNAVEVDNITVLCNNGRYCLHDDPHNTNPGTRHIYRHCRFVRNVKTISITSFVQVIGMGYVDNGYYEFDGCVFESHLTGSLNYCAGGHEGATDNAWNNSADKGPLIVFRDCVMTTQYGSNAMRFQTINTQNQQHIRVQILGCYVGGAIWLDQYKANSKQFFDLELLRSGNPTITVDIGAANPYPPQVYN